MRTKMQIISGGFAIFALALALGGEGYSQPAKEEALPRPDTIFTSLRDVTVYGVRLYNDQGDYAGCYRVFQGALIAVRPYLISNPNLLKQVDDALSNAEKLPRMADRALHLRTTLDAVRDAYRTPEKKLEKIPDPKKIEKIVDPKKVEMKIEETKKIEAPKKDEPKKEAPKKVDDVKKDDPKKKDEPKKDDKKAVPVPKDELQTDPKNNPRSDGKQGTAALQTSKWSDWGYLRRASFDVNGSPAYCLEKRTGEPLLYATAKPEVALPDYVGKLVSLYGFFEYHKENYPRVEIMIASKIVVPLD